MVVRTVRRPSGLGVSQVACLTRADVVRLRSKHDRSIAGGLLSLLRLPHDTAHSYHAFCVYLILDVICMYLIELEVRKRG